MRYLIILSLFIGFSAQANTCKTLGNSLTWFLYQESDSFDVKPGTATTYEYGCTDWDTETFSNQKNKKRIETICKTMKKEGCK